jgi:hypothetical protein
MATAANRPDHAARRLFPWAVLTAVLAVALASPIAYSDAFVDTVLRREHLSAADLRARDAGRAVVKTLDTSVRQELAYFGVVAINASPERFIDRFADIVRFERGPGVPQIGRFSASPRAEDLAPLTLPPADIAALAKCRPGDCALKLSADAISRFRDRVDWSSSNVSLQVNAVARDMLLDLVRKYQARGNAALGEYHDDDEPLSVAHEFRAVLASSHPLPLPVPRLLAYLDDYPHNRPAGATEFFYWSVVDFGLKPTVRVNHVVIYPLDADPSGVSHVIAIKQLYATHYFRSALELRFLAAGQGPDPRGFQLLSLTRSRIDGTSGVRGSLLRPIISRRSRNAVRGYLEHLKRQVEVGQPPASQACSPVADAQVCVEAG